MSFDTCTITFASQPSFDHVHYCSLAYTVYARSSLPNFVVNGFFSTGLVKRFNQDPKRHKHRPGGPASSSTTTVHFAIPFAIASLRCRHQSELAHKRLTYCQVEVTWLNHVNNTSAFASVMQDLRNQLQWQISMQHLLISKQNVLQVNQQYHNNNGPLGSVNTTHQTTPLS